MQADDHDKDYRIHYASLQPSMVHLETSTLMRVLPGFPIHTIFTDDPTTGFVSRGDFVNLSAPLKAPLKAKGSFVLFCKIKAAQIDI